MVVLLDELEEEYKLVELEVELEEEYKLVELEVEYRLVELEVEYRVVELEDELEYRVVELEGRVVDRSVVDCRVVVDCGGTYDASRMPFEEAIAEEESLSVFDAMTPPCVNQPWKDVPAYDGCAAIEYEISPTK